MRGRDLRSVSTPRGPGADDVADDEASATIEVLPVVVVSQVFPARPSSIPGIRDFVRDGLARAPLTGAERQEVEATVALALLEAAGPTGAIEVTFREFPDHVEVDVLRSRMPAGEAAARPSEPDDAAPGGGSTSPRTGTFAEWIADALSREGLTQEAAARRLGVSVKTIGRWVGGATEPRLRDLRRIREIFGATPVP